MYIFRNIVNLEKFLSFFFIDIHRAIFHRSGSVSLHLSFLYCFLHTSSSRPHNIYKSHSVVSDSLQPQNPWNSPHQNTGVGSCSHLQGIFQTQGLNPGLLQWQWIFFFYQLSHQGSPQAPQGRFISQYAPIPLCYNMTWVNTLGRRIVLSGCLATAYLYKEMGLQICTYISH